MISEIVPLRRWLILYYALFQRRPVLFLFGRADEIVPPYLMTDYVIL